MNKRVKYIRTSIGLIPKDWKIEKAGSIFKNSRIKGSPNLSMLSLTMRDGFVRRDDLDRKMQPDLPYDKNLKVELGDIAYNMMRAWQGAIALAIEKGMVSPAYVVLKPTKEAFSNYYFHLFKSSHYQYLITSYSYGITSDRLRLYYKDFASIPVPLPPLPEQKKIAEILSAWDKAIEQTKSLIEAKKKLKKGLMQKLLAGEMRFPEFGKIAKKGELPDGWKFTKLKDLLIKIERPIEFDNRKFYPLVSVKRNSNGLIHRETLLGSKILVKDLYTLQENDFLISKMQVVHGALGMVTKKFESMYISGSYIVLNTKDQNKFNIHYFDYLSKTKYIYHAALISSYGVTIEKMTFNLRWFLKTIVAIPTNINEQTKIVSVLDTLNLEISILIEKLSLLQTQKKGLLQKLLTGQIRVQVDSPKPKAKKK
ncbi:restriction endonuclease subunit S [Leptospira neocaledonica]|nr:restriction endonuclease subunit S [Leptospira neocaledonica]